jgi:hypothetical protein
MLGGFIVGVASSSHKASIRIYNNETEYDKWEFLAVGQGIADLLAPGGTAAGQTTPAEKPGSGQNPGQNPGQKPAPNPGTGDQSGTGVPPTPIEPDNP